MSSAKKNKAATRSEATQSEASDDSLGDSLKKYFRELIEVTEKRLTEKIDGLKLELSEVKAELSTVKLELINTKKDLTIVTQENNVLKLEVKRLADKNEKNEQRSRRQNIRIEGIEFKDGDSDDDLPSKIAKVLADGGIQFTENDINRCHYSAKPSEKDGR